MSQSGVAEPGSRECILLLDSRESRSFTLREHFEAEGFTVRVVQTAAEALELFRIQDPDLVLLDTSAEEARDLLDELLVLDPELPILLITAPEEASRALEAVTRGADRFLLEPVALPALQVVVERTLEHRRWGRLDRARRRLEEADTLDPLRGTSPAIQELVERVARISEAQGPVLLTGERGTGKSFLASWIHHHGPRRAQPYLGLHCAPRSPGRLEVELFGHEPGAFGQVAFRRRGLLELAHQGTLCLEEIGDLALGLQPRLLTCLEEQRVARQGALRDRRVDLRLIATSSGSLEQEVRAGRFRADLYHRIGALPLRVPALRERLEDLPLLARSLLESIALELGQPVPVLTTAALELLARHSWPGNLRELHNVLERAVLRAEGRPLRSDDLRSNGGPEGVVGEPFSTLEEVERRHIQAALERTGGHVGEAAGVLGIPRSTLYQRLKRLGISRLRRESKPEGDPGSL